MRASSSQRRGAGGTQPRGLPAPAGPRARRPGAGGGAGAVQYPPAAPAAPPAAPRPPPPQGRQLRLAAGTDPGGVSKTGVTALDVAREFKNEAAIRILAAPPPERK